MIIIAFFNFFLRHSWCGFKSLGPPNLRNGRSDRKLTVITGYGKSSVGPIKLKPAVLQWLKQFHYELVIHLFCLRKTANSLKNAFF